MDTGTIRVFLLDDHEIVRRGIRQLSRARTTSAWSERQVPRSQRGRASHRRDLIEELPAGLYEVLVPEGLEELAERLPTDQRASQPGADRSCRRGDLNSCRRRFA